MVRTGRRARSLERVRIVSSKASSQTYPTIPFDLRIARVHARLDAEFAAAGTPVGDADLMIAATAVWLDYRIATRDLRSFPKIRGLHVVRW
jgi:predicted nucleic acid-binding protein